MEEKSANLAKWLQETNRQTMEKRVVGLQNSGGLCEIHTGVKMSLKVSKQQKRGKHANMDLKRGRQQKRSDMETNGVSLNFLHFVVYKKVELKIAAATPNSSADFLLFC